MNALPQVCPATATVSLIAAAAVRRGVQYASPCKPCSLLSLYPSAAAFLKRAASYGQGLSALGRGASQPTAVPPSTSPWTGQSRFTWPLLPHLKHATSLAAHEYGVHVGVLGGLGLLSWALLLVAGLWCRCGVRVCSAPLPALGLSTAFMSASHSALPFGRLGVSLVSLTSVPASLTIATSSRTPTLHSEAQKGDCAWRRAGSRGAAGHPHCELPHSVSLCKHVGQSATVYTQRPLVYSDHKG